MVLGGECLWVSGRLVWSLGGVCGLESGLLIWVLCLLSGRVWGGQGGGSDLALRAVGSVWGACEAWWGLTVVLWAGAAGVLLRRCSAFMMCLLPAACCLLTTYDFC